MNNNNEGFSPENIKDLKDKMNKINKSFVLNDTEDNSEEYKNFFFVGQYEGQEVIYDAVIYTLRLHHNSEVYEIAEHRAAKRFPEYKNFQLNEEESNGVPPSEIEEEIGMYMAEVIMELEDEEVVKVQEHIEIDPVVDFGVGLDVGLNVEVVDDHVIENFIQDFNQGNLKLDKTLYSFQSDDNEDQND